MAGQICNSQQDFSPDIFYAVPLTSGVLVNNTLCPQFWAWFTIPTRTTVTFNRLEQQGANWVEVPVTQTIENGIQVSVDAGYDYERYRFTTLSVLMVNGTPPEDIGDAAPYSALFGKRPLQQRGLDNEEPAAVPVFDTPPFAKRQRTVDV